MTSGINAFQKLIYPAWDYFFDRYCKTIFEHGGLIIDIGCGLRIDKARGNRVDVGHQKKFMPFLSNPKVQYKVTDYTNKYNPDYVEDIHKLSFLDTIAPPRFFTRFLDNCSGRMRSISEIQTSGYNIFIRK